MIDFFKIRKLAPFVMCSETISTITCFLIFEFVAKVERFEFSHGKILYNSTGKVSSKVNSYREEPSEYFAQKVVTL